LAVKQNQVVNAAVVQLFSCKKSCSCKPV